MLFLELLHLGLKGREALSLPDLFHREGEGK